VENTLKSSHRTSADVDALLPLVHNNQNGIGLLSRCFSSTFILKSQVLRVKCFYCVAGATFNCALQFVDFVLIEVSIKSRLVCVFMCIFICKILFS
jgi:hypothetical protein